MHDKISAYLKKNLGTGQISNSTELVRSGIIDSVGIPDLVSYLERTFSVRIPTKKLSPSNFSSVDAMVKLVKSVR